MTQRTVLEENKRFSDSLIWEIGQRAYETLGPRAWIRQGGVPFQITSNPFIAKKYVSLIIASLRRLKPQLYSMEPLYILELGSGNGKFAFLFLRDLVDALKELQWHHLSLCYVISDISEKNIEFCENHPLLQSFIQQGLLDFAVYNPQKQSSFFLRVKKKTLQSTAHPLIAIANYFLDTIPQDLFKISAGILYEGRVSLFTSQTSYDLMDPSLIATLHVEASYTPILDISSYFKDLKKLLPLIENYRQNFSDTVFLLPIAGFEVAQHLLALCNKRLLLIAGDKGSCTLSQVCKNASPDFNFHTTFSYPVNFHALSSYFDTCGMETLMPKYPEDRFNVILFLGDMNDALLDIKRSYREEFDSFGPQSLFDHVHLFEKESEKPSLKLLLLEIELAEWDASLFFLFWDKIKTHLLSLDEKEKSDFLSYVDQVILRFFPLCKEESLLLCELGLKIEEMGFSEKALELFKYALKFEELTYSFSRFDKETIEPLKRHSDILQVGFGSIALSDLIQKSSPKSHTIIALSSLEKEAAISWIESGKKAKLVASDDWQEAINALETFDAIFFIPFPNPLLQSFNTNVQPPLLVETGRKKMQAIEEMMPCPKDIVFSDEDIEAFFHLLKQEHFEQRHLLKFFAELKDKQAISENQLKKILATLRKEGYSSDEIGNQLFFKESQASLRSFLEAENILLFSLLSLCLAKHLKEGGVFQAFLNDPISKAEHMRFFEEVVLNPFLEFHEESIEGGAYARKVRVCRK